MLLLMEEALERILQQIRPRGTEEIRINQADERVAATELPAGLSLPISNNSSMDGDALQTADVKSSSPAQPVMLECSGEIPAGSKPDKVVTTGTCLRIFTGSPLPEGADAVVM